MNQAYEKLIKKLGEERVKIGEPMSKHTTFRIGGPADLYFEGRKKEELLRSIRLAKENKIPIFLLGGGSNILVSDQGFRGIVIRNLVTGAKIIGRVSKSREIDGQREVPHGAVDPGKYLQASDLDYPDEPLIMEIEVYSGTPLQSLINWSFKNNLSGLQWFAGIPGTVGGAVVNNIHGYTRLFSNFVKKMKVIDQEGNLKETLKDQVTFGYDYSDLLKRYLAIVSVNLLLAEGDLKRAEFVYNEWWRRKLKVQPQKNCPGSIFKNVTLKVAKKAGAPTPSAGWFIDQCGLKGKRVGGAQVSEKHANFIVNTGSARASEVIKLINLIKKKVEERFGVRLEEEIVLVGFSPLSCSSRVPESFERKID
jgi:UDP-N-acetylmuramate dehydrogenase